MKRTKLTLAVVLLACTTFFLGMLLQGAAVAQEVEAAAETAPSEEMLRIADALETIAENSDNLKAMNETLQQIVERLAAIEEELAWKRLDDEQ